MFRNQFEKHNRICSAVGCSIHQDYIGQYDAKGNLVLTPTTTTDLYAKIQSHKDSVDINVILNRYMSGDTTVLQRVQGAYLDVTEMPKTYMEVLNLSKRAEDEFDKLPVEIKEKFGNNFAAYMAELGSDTWLNKLGISRQSDEKFKNADAVVQDPAEKEVKSE